MEIVLTTLTAVVLIFLSAAFSGLNIGLMMVRPEELERKAKQGDEVAKKVYRYRKNGNYLLICVLLGNVSVISILTLVLDNFAGGVVAGIVTTLLVTAFGEILPQSFFSRRGYRLTRYFFWLLDFMFVILWPIAYPGAKLLDSFIGDELPALYTHEELRHMIKDHAEHEHSKVDYDESRIVSGALQFSHETAGDIATPLNDLTAVDLDDEVDASLVSMIKREGHSRLPVRSASGDYVGILYVKDLLGRDLPVPVSHVYRDKLFDISSDARLDTALSRFIQTKSHLFLVTNDDGQAIGVLTLEDVIEEIIKREIEDEFDEEVK
ncbi:MAG TPA: CNNM domain-containing protein [Patescibacteria group bacterium]|jgi:metal transporter CNNM|nr:CNNM domain-containing protein [Patescibacteria group bacterium]